MSILQNSLIIWETVRDIYPNIESNRDELAYNPEEFFEELRNLLRQNSNYNCEDINYCIDTCLMYIDDIGNNEKKELIIKALIKLQKSLKE